MVSSAIRKMLRPSPQRGVHVAQSTLYTLPKLVRVRIPTYLRPLEPVVRIAPGGSPLPYLQ